MDDDAHPFGGLSWFWTSGNHGSTLQTPWYDTANPSRAVTFAMGPHQRLSGVTGLDNIFGYATATDPQDYQPCNMTLTGTYMLLETRANRRSRPCLRAGVKPKVCASAAMIGIYLRIGL